MKVLMISEYWYPKIEGGGEQSAFLLAKNLAKQRVEVHVLTSWFKGLKKEDIIDGIFIHRKLKTGNPNSFFGNIKRSLFFNQSLKKKFLEITKNQEFDIIHCMNITSANIIKLKSKTNSKFVAHINSLLPFCPKGNLMYCNKEPCSKFCTFSLFLRCFLNSDELGKIKNRFFLKYNPIFWFYIYNKFKKLQKESRKFDLLITISNYMKNELKKRKYSKIEIVPNPIEIRKFINQKKINNKIPKILYLGTYTKSKGPQILLEALKNLKLKYEANFYGNGPLKDKMKTFVKKNNLNIKIHKKVNYNKIPEIFAKHDVIIFPSVWPEPFGRIAIEALAARKPIIASKTGGINDIIKDKKNGILIEPGNIKELKESIEKLIRNKKLKDKLIRAGLEEIRKYSEENIVKRVIKIYRRL